MTVAAHARVLDVRIVLRFDAQRIIHRVGNDLLIGKRPEDLVSVAGSKVAGNVVVQETRNPIGFALHHLVFHDPVTSHATDAIARQRAVDVGFGISWFRIIVSGKDKFRFEVALVRSAVIIVQPPLAHHAVTLEASVINRFDLFFYFRRVVLEESLHERNLAIELRVEDRIASGQAHWRPAPLAEWRNVHLRSRAIWLLGAGIKHRVAVRAAAVTAHAGIRRKKLIGIGRRRWLWAQVFRDDVVESFAWQFADLVHGHGSNRFVESYELRVGGCSWWQLRLLFAKLRGDLLPQLPRKLIVSASFNLLVARRSIALTGFWRRRRRGFGSPREVDKVSVVITGEAFDVFGVTKGQLLLGGGVAARAIEPEAAIGNSKRRLVVVHALRGPALIPIPTILRALRVLDHDGPTAKQWRPLDLIAGRRRRVLFFHDHGAIGNYLSGIRTQQPVDDRGRVINLHRRVHTITRAVDVWSGVARCFVFTPIPVAIPAAG